MVAIYPTAAGTWSTRTWNKDADGTAYGTTPQVGDIVYANNLAITVDVSIHIASLRTTAGTTAAAGGSFTVTANGLTSTIDNDITPGSANCLVSGVAGANVHTITGSGLTINGSSTTTTVRGLNLSSTGTTNVTANSVGGTQTSAAGVIVSNTGTLNFTGNVTGGSGASSYGVLNNSSGTVNVSNTSTGGSSSSAPGAFNNSSGTLNLTHVAASSTTPGVSDAAAVAGVVTVSGNLTNNGNISASTATHLQVAQISQWTIAKSSGTVTLQAPGGSGRGMRNVGVDGVQTL